MAEGKCYATNLSFYILSKRNLIQDVILPTDKGNTFGAGRT